MYFKLKSLAFAATILLFASNLHAADAASPAPQIQNLQEQLNQLINKVDAKQQTINSLSEEMINLRKKVNSLNREKLKDAPSMQAENMSGLDSSRFSFGGYGEVHANFIEGKDASGNSNDMFDIHRLVAFIGYRFNDWIRFQSEIELEHALVSNSGGGEVEVEQAYVDFLLSDLLNIRAGRTLVPVGYINQHHEPPTFNGVERPSFTKYIVPSTWWSDGVGIFGSLGSRITYEAYLLAGLDGSQFDDTNGIRGSRLKERPSLNDPAYAVRLDYFPLADSESSLVSHLRIGTSFYRSGLDNGNKGKDPGTAGDISIYSADFSANILRLDLKGAVAFEEIDGAAMIGGGVAEEIFGYYTEAGYHILPASWKKGKLKEADAIAFVRYDDYDTQYTMPSGVAENPAGDRYDWTFGITFLPVPNLAIKADYQVKKSAAAIDPDNAINLGIGWQF